MRSELVRRWTDALRRFFGRRAQPALRIVDVRPLHPGTALYVADIDERRIVFAATPHAVALLARYRHRAARTGKGHESNAV
jgi:hypothetical protein